MCLSVPARVVSIAGVKAEVEVYGKRREVFLAFDNGNDVALGDWLLVYGQVALTRLEDDVAKETIALLERLETQG